MDFFPLFHTPRPPTSPHLDALAAESTVFDRAYAPSPWTYSSTASLMTGLYPAAHGAILPGAIRTEAAAKGGVVQLPTISYRDCRNGGTCKKPHCLTHQKTK